MDSLYAELKHFETVFDLYKKQLDEIDLFIKIVEEQKPFASVNQTLLGSENEFIKGLLDLSNSAVQYNAVIVSLYGSYELFVNELLKKYFLYLKDRHFNYSAFPQKLQNKNLHDSADFLNNPHRYLNLGLDNSRVITSLYQAIIEGQSSAMLQEFVIMHSGNLKTKQLLELLETFDFGDPFGKLKSHGKFCDYLSSSNYKSGDFFQVLDILVEERNKVAHGWVTDDRIAYSEIRSEFVSFFFNLCLAIKDMICSRIIQDYMDDSIIECFNPIIELYENGAIIGINSGTFKLKLNECLYYSTPNGWNYYTMIQGLRIGDKDRTFIRSENKDISIKIDKKVKIRYQIWGYKN